MDIIKIGLAGFGTVGTGLARIMDENQDMIMSRIGKKLEIKNVLVRSLDKKRDYLPGPACRFTADPSELINDPETSIVVELMGGIDAAHDLIEKALNAGKHVVTANKALLAEKGRDLFELAAAKGLGLYYESSVAGAIPIVEPLKTSLAGNKIKSLVGILNGTSNYILSQMSTGGLDFDTALGQAQELGYAEADPTLDIEGMDAAHKLTLLVRLAFGQHYPYELLPVSGIHEVERQDIEFAREFGYRLKLIAQVKDVGGKLEAGVFPALVHYKYLLARVGSNYNAVRLEANAAGPLFFHGQGAGDLPTGSAVLSDIMTICRQGFYPDNTGFCHQALPDANILSSELAVSRHYFRIMVQDKPGVMGTVATTMAERGISIAQAVQKGEENAQEVPIVFLTHKAQAKAVTEAIEEINSMSFTVTPTVHYRIL